MELQVNNQPDMDSGIGTWKAFMGVVTSPSETFAKLAEDPRTWLPSLYMALLAGLFTLPFFAKYQEYATVLLKKTLTQLPPGMDLTQLAKVSAISTMVTFPLMMFFSPLILAALLKLLNFVMGEEAKFKQIWTITVFSRVPALLGLLVANLLMLTATGDNLVLTVATRTSLAVFLPKTVSPFLFSLFTGFDVFGIWGLVLTVIGIAKVFRSKLSGVGAVIFGVWLVYCLVAAYLGQFKVAQLLS